MTLLLLSLLTACDRDAAPEVQDAPTAAPLRPAGLHRLTEAQWRASVLALTGVEHAGPLPEDYVLYNYASVGAAQVTIPPYDLELYETAAWEVALAALPDAAALEQTLGCWPEGPLGMEDLAEDAARDCMGPALADLAARAWRRPLAASELDALLALEDEVMARTGQPLLAARAGMVAVLLSPHFLFRVEGGGPAEGPGRPYTDHELAARLALLLTDGPPDSPLLDDADAGRLTADPDALREHAARLLATPEARDTLSRFFAEWMDLGRLEVADKDPSLYPWFDAAARASMARELELLFEEVVFDRDVGFTELLTTDIAYVDDTLAAIYGVSAPGPGLQRVRLPAEQARGGVLGRAGLLALNAHASLTSPTRRGKFVRARLLCQDIPPPPEGVDASLDEEAVEGSLRDRLSQHATDPACSGCHQLMDPIGFALERFGPVGEWRELDHGHPIDTTATLDGVSIDGATDLGAALAAHPNLSWCLSTQLWRDAVGAVEESDDTEALDALAARAEALDLRIGPLLLELVDSEAFRYAAPGAAPEAPALREVCSGEDDDGDGQIDEDLVRACAAPWGPGLQSCARGEWLTCVGPPPPPEACDGEDNDLDEAVDEGLSVEVAALARGALVAAHGACDPDGAPWTDTCFSAAHRACAARGCGLVTGLGPVARDDGRALSAVSCLDAEEGSVQSLSYAALSAQHAGCSEAAPYGPSCNAAIHRTCAAMGLTTGYGPVEHAGDLAIAVCTPGASVHATTYTELSGLVAACDGATERAGASCNEAIHRHCRSLGAATGHGPLENSGDLAYVACLGVREE